MATAALTHYTPEEYLALERHAEFKSEYLDGRIVAMTGATALHNRLAGAVYAELRARLRGRPCAPFIGDMRVQVGGGRRYTYPDVVVVCGAPAFMDGSLDTLTNPALIVEVLSPSTEAYDRGEKFLHYRTIESLREYVLIAQDRVLVDRFVRGGEFWTLSTISDLDVALELTCVDCSIPSARSTTASSFPPPRRTSGTERPEPRLYPHPTRPHSFPRECPLSRKPPGMLWLLLATARMSPP